MLIALVLGYLFLGGSRGAVDFGYFYTKQAEDLIKTHVSDSERKKSALESAENVKKAIEAMGKQMQTNSEGIKKLYEDYSSTPEQWNIAIQEGIDAEQLPFYDVVHSRQAVLKSVTPQEWTAIIADAKREDEVAAKAAENAAKARVKA